jgi:hypothetical protein
MLDIIKCRLFFVQVVFAGLITFLRCMSIGTAAIERSVSLCVLINVFVRWTHICQSHAMSRKHPVQLNVVPRWANAGQMFD